MTKLPDLDYKTICEQLDVDNVPVNYLIEMHFNL